jgi:histidine triad (HIT) family protein
MDCIFCKIANKEMDSDIIYEDKDFIAFHDISPRAPIHVLIIPKKHIVSVNYLKEEHKELIGSLFLVAQKVVGQLGIRDKGYKLAFNVGKDGGQIVDHLHLHVLGGWKVKQGVDVQKIP